MRLVQERRISLDDRVGSKAIRSTDLRNYQLENQWTSENKIPIHCHQQNLKFECEIRELQLKISIC